MNEAASPVPPRKGNCFDLLRVVLAGFVVVTHGHEILGLEDPSRPLFKDQLGIGNLAVLGFFGISGYLIASSWVRTPRIVPFALSRALRILPGLWGVLLVSALCFGPLLYRLQNLEAPYPWTGEESALSYVVQNAAVQVRQWDIGQATSLAPREGLNYSLWSLAPESYCYVFLMIAGLGGALIVNRILLLAFVAGLMSIHMLLLTSTPYGPNIAPTFLYLSGLQSYYLAFATGSLLFAYRDHFVNDRGATALLALATAVLLKFGGFILLGPMLFPMFLISLGHAFNFRLKTDISYGLYLYHVPVLHCLKATGFASTHPWVFITTGGGIAALAALASWRFIESPALQWKSLFRRNGSPPAAVSNPAAPQLPPPGETAPRDSLVST